MLTYSDFLDEMFGDGEGKDNRRMKEARDERKVEYYCSSCCSMPLSAPQRLRKCNPLGIVVSIGQLRSCHIYDYCHSSTLLLLLKTESSFYAAE